MNQILTDMVEVKEKNREINEIRKKEAKSKEEEIVSLKNEVRELSKKIDDNLNKLPFGGSFDTLPLSASSLATISGEIPIASHEVSAEKYLWGNSKGHIIGRSDFDYQGIGEEASLEAHVRDVLVPKEPWGSDDGETK